MLYAIGMNDIPVNSKMTDTKARLIDSATQLFAKQGFDGTSTREIAAQAGCNISLINHYFGGKHGLMQAIVSDCFDAEEQQLKSLLAGEVVSEEPISRFVDFFFDLFYRNPQVMRIIQREMVNQENPTADYARGRIKSNLDMMAELIRRSPNIKCSDVSPHILADMLVGMILFCLLDRDNLRDREALQSIKHFIKSCFLVDVQQ